MIIDIIIVAAFVLFGIIGFMRGFVRSALSMVKVSVSVIAAIIFARPVATVLDKAFKLATACSNAFGTNKTNGGYILIAIVAIVIFILIRLALKIINKIVDKTTEKNKGISIVNRILGLLFGLLRFAFIFCILSAIFYVITIIPFLKGAHTWIFTGSRIAVHLYNTAVNLILVKALHAIGGALGM